MKLTRILILDTSPIRRGAQVFAEELALRLESGGCEVSRVYLFSAKESQTVSLGIQDRVLFFSAESRLETFPTFQPGILEELRIEIRKLKPQLILCNGSKALKYGAWVRIFGLDYGAKVVGRFIDDAAFWNGNAVKKWVYAFWLNRLDGMVGVSQSTLNSMIRHYRFQKPSTVIHRVFDSQKFEKAPTRAEARRQLGLKEEDEVLLFLGNFTSQKRPDRFIEIVQELAKTRPNLKALIVGDGVLRKELERSLLSPVGYPDKYQAQHLNESSVSRLRSQVFFKGYQSDVSPFLAAADLLVLTSDTEGLPGVVLEAAHFEVPTVATEVGGIRECLIDGETGIFVPDRSVVSFCEKINFLLDHPQDRKAIGARAKTFIAQNFRMDQVANQYLDFFWSIFKIPE